MECKNLHVLPDTIANSVVMAWLGLARNNGSVSQNSNTEDQPGEVINIEHRIDYKMREGC